MTSKEQKAEKHNTGSAVPTKLPSVCFYPMQLQQLSLLTVNNKKNTWTRGSEERSENALCVLRRCCLDELLSAQRAQSSSHASLQLPPPGGGGRKKRRNVVVVTRLLENRLMFVGDVRLSYSSKASQTLDGKSFCIFHPTIL